MGGLVTKRNAAMFLAVVMMIASAMKMVNAHESESIELTFRSFEEDDLNKLHACCPSMTAWNCYRVCRLKGNQKTCSNVCSCKLVETLTNECVRLNRESMDERAQIMTQMFLKEQVSQTDMPCCENAESLNCFWRCRMVPWACAKRCSCVLVTELTPNCYQGVNEIPELQHGIDGEPKLSTEMFLKEQGSNKLRACCQNAQRWNCYRACRLTGSQQVCANLCSCALVTQLTPNCYRGVNEIPELQHGIDGEPKLSAQD